MNVEKFISYQIESQFPDLYKEQGPELVGFVKAYYEFLESDISGYYITGYKITGDTESNLAYFCEKYTTYTEGYARLLVLQSDTSYGDLRLTQARNQSIFHNRRLFDYNDIDNTLSEMLLFYKNKFLSGLPFKGESVRFIVKHILDLYRRKGSVEGLELFFRLFYNEHIHVHYPSVDILKPSTSKWKVGQYLELFPTDPSKLALLKRLPIYGSISGATAIVDRVNFVMISNTLIPIIHLSNLKGQFVRFDDIIYNNNTYGVVRGSLDSVLISDSDVNEGTSGNEIGDIVEIYGDDGIGGRGRVINVTQEISGEIDYVISDGGFGYTTTNTDIIVSNQSLFFDSAELPLKPFEKVKQNSTGALGYVVGQDNISVGLYLLSSNSFVISSNSVNTHLRTIDRDENKNVKIMFASEFNNSSSADIGDLENIQEISIIPDLIEDFLDVPLNASNFSSPPAIRPMSGNAPFGTPPININTSLADAFEYINLDIGSIVSLKNIDPGFNYVNNVFVLAKENMISRFKLSNQLISYDPLSGVNFGVGDIIVQNDPAGPSGNKDIRGIIKAKTGTVLDVAQLTFKSFSTANTFYLENSFTPVSITSLGRNYDALPIGLNADIYGRTIAAIGKITEVEVFDSGIGFLDESKVYMKNLTRNIGVVSATGTASSKSQGKTEGVWESKTSHLNSKKVIQDSNFYQDFSYQIASKLNPDLYISALKEIAHVAGTKVFHKIDIEEDINIGITSSSEFIRNSVTVFELMTNDNQGLQTQDGMQLTGIQYKTIEE